MVTAGKMPHFASLEILILPGVVARIFNLNPDTEADGAL